MKTQLFLKGVLTCLPLALGVIPFGLVAAISAGEAGFSPLETLSLSVLVFAGASQLTVLEMLKSGAPAALAVLAAIVVNLRFIMYSASLAPHVRNAPKPMRALMAYLLTDQAFALSLDANATDEASSFRGAWFYTGAAATLWMAWQGGTGLGILLGAGVPASWSLDFSVALAFLALVVPHLARKPALMAAIVSCVIYALTREFPYGLGLLLAAIAGMSTGAWAEGKKA